MHHAHDVAMGGHKVWHNDNTLGVYCDLQEMGNVMVTALNDVHFFRNQWGVGMADKPSWQYAFANGPSEWLLRCLARLLASLLS